MQYADVRHWEPEVLPRTDGMFDAWRDAPWNRPLVGARVDVQRTEALAALGEYLPRGSKYSSVVRLEHGQDSRSFAGGVPYQLATATNRRVLRYTEPWWKVSTVSLPLRSAGNRRTGDPNASSLTGSHDLQCFIVGDGTYIEVSSLNTASLLDPRRYVAGTSLQCGRVSTFDLSRPWKPGNLGTTAAKIPLVPMLPRPEEFAARKIPHAMQLCVGGYSNARATGYASSTDGKIPGHPLRAGDMLRLTEAAVKRLLPAATSGSTARMYRAPGLDGEPTRDARTLVEALAAYGCVVADYTNPEVGHALRLPQTREIDLGTLALDITDFEIVTV